MKENDMENLRRVQTTLCRIHHDAVHNINPLIIQEGIEACIDTLIDINDAIDEELNNNFKKHLIREVRQIKKTIDYLEHSINQDNAEEAMIFINSIKKNMDNIRQGVRKTEAI